MLMFTHKTHSYLKPVTPERHNGNSALKHAVVKVIAFDTSKVACYFLKKILSVPKPNLKTYGLQKTKTINPGFPTGETLGL